MQRGNINYLVNSLLKQFGKTPKFTALDKIYRNWDQIIDNKYLKYCYPQKINLNPEQKTCKLLVVSYNSATSFYINNNKNYIISKINTYFGYNAVENVYIQEIPTIIKDNHTKKIKKELTSEEMNYIENIKNKNNKLEDSLRGLAKSIFEY